MKPTSPGEHARRIGIIMNGVTGRMGTNQHLIRSILAIREQGGVALADGTRALPDPILVGRNPVKLQNLSETHGIERWSTDLEACLAHADDPIYFDSQITTLRAEAVRAAMAAGKHVYCEKPIATDLGEALDLARAAQEAGIKHGVVQDKLWLPGLVKLKRLIDGEFFGRILSVRIEFGYWVFTGELQPAQRPSWNYRAADGGGIIVDMFAHWRYVLDNLFGPVKAVSCLGATHIPRRWDEQGEPYRVTADDAAYATFELEGGVIAQVNSSWAVRVRRDDLLTMQVDGTEGSAVAGLRECRVQDRSQTPKPVWNPDVPKETDFHDGWLEVPDKQDVQNAFKVQWEHFIRHVVEDAPFPWDFLEGAKGLQLAERALTSWQERRWVEIEELTL